MRSNLFSFFVLAIAVAASAAPVTVNLTQFHCTAADALPLDFELSTQGGSLSKLLRHAHSRSRGM